MNPDFEIRAVDASNIDQLGFFCLMSRTKAPGYHAKRQWLLERFAEGLRINLIHELGNRTVGFVEMIPGEHTWRAIHAPGYLVIHCLWVVGQGKGKGYGTLLIQSSLAEARRQGLHGVVMLASDGNWLAGQALFLRQGFAPVDRCDCLPDAPMGNKKRPAFHLLLHRFDDAPAPAFPTDWAARQAACGPGLTVFATPQCPYNADATAQVLQIADERGIPARVIPLTSAQDAQTLSPSPYGTYGIVRDGRLLSYHYLCRKELEEKLAPTEATHVHA